MSADWYLSSWATDTLTVVEAIETETTLTLDPPSVEPGGIYNYKGKLTRIDTGAGIEGMDIIALRYEDGSWVDVGNGITDASGDYNISVVAPYTVGDYNCMAAFLGVDPFAASSAQGRLSMGVLKPIWAVASAVLGIALIMLGYSP